MEHMMFSPLSCNANLTVLDCTSATTLSSILASTSANATALIPCGTCALEDTVDGSTLAFPDGLDVEGMLYVPPTANVVIEATHIFVQGILKIDPPATASNSVRVRMVGTDDQYLHPHSENAMACNMTTGCNVGKKSIVVAGGRLDINGLSDGTCPTWTKLQSVVPPTGLDDDTGCPLDHDLLKGDGTLESGSKFGFFQHHGGGSFGVAVDAEDGNNSHLSQSGRCCDFTGLGMNLNGTCAGIPSESNNGGEYRFSIRYRSSNPNEVPDTNGNPHLQLWAGYGDNIGSCPAAIDNEWVTCEKTITLSDNQASSLERLVMGMSLHPNKNVDYDDIVFEAIPRPYKVTVGPQAAECWGSRPSADVVITNKKKNGGYMNQLVKTLASVDIATGQISFGTAGGLADSGLPEDENPDMASEVAWLSRATVFEAEGDGPSDDNFAALHGGHLMIFHTPGVVQRLEGVEFRNFGQQGNLGRYPIHFHMSGHVPGSIVRKNSIRESKQRCVVIHGSHDVIVEDNVAMDSYGHCYILEDGGETNNTFVGNLGARTRAQGISIGSSDNFPATIWITNPSNHWINNVCAGSQHSGVWFELRDIRGDSASLPENQGINPRSLSLGTFRDNTAHSNQDAGVRTYAPGFLPPEEALFEGIRMYLNANTAGLFLHGTTRVRVKNAFFAQNKKGILYFGNGGNFVESSTFVGECGDVGICFSIEPRSGQISVINSTFSGYVDGCDVGSYGAALQIESIQPKSEYDMPILSGITVDSNAAQAIDIKSPFENENIYLEDPTGAFNPSGSPGFFINNQAHMTAFIDSGLCSPGLNDGSPVGDGLFCEGVCLRRLLVDTGCCSQKHSRPDSDYQMVVTSKSDPSKTFTFDKYIRQSGLWYQGKEFDAVLPSDQYSVHFLSVPDGQVMVPAVVVRFRDEVVSDSPPICSSYITEASIDLECPEGYQLNTDGVTCVVPPCLGRGAACNHHGSCTSDCCSECCSGISTTGDSRVCM